MSWAICGDCGDGVVWALDEECDDGNAGGCSPSCAHLPPEGLFCNENESSEVTYIKSGFPDWEWQGCAAGEIAEGCTCTGTADQKRHIYALDYCENLTWGGFDDWVLPNIDELRSLIRGCPQNELGEGNTCSITHQCSYSTNNENTCGTDYCDGCTDWEGPGNEGCYWPADLPGMSEGACSSSRFWSSSLRSASDGYRVGFCDGFVDGLNLIDGDNKVRCVRSRP